MIWQQIITERLHTAGGSALSSSQVRQCSLQDITSTSMASLWLVWKYYTEESALGHTGRYSYHTQRHLLETAEEEMVSSS